MAPSPQDDCVLNGHTDAEGPPPDRQRSIERSWSLDTHEIQLSHFGLLEPPSSLPQSPSETVLQPRPDMPLLAGHSAEDVEQACGRPGSGMGAFCSCPSSPKYLAEVGSTVLGVSRESVQMVSPPWQGVCLIVRTRSEETLHGATDRGEWNDCRCARASFSVVRLSRTSRMQTSGVMAPVLGTHTQAQGAWRVVANAHRP